MLEKRLLWDGHATMRDQQRGAVFRDETALLWSGCCSAAGREPGRIALVPATAAVDVGPVAANLAFHLASMGRSTWLVDADLRQPRLAALLRRVDDGAPAPTLEEVVEEPERLDEVVTAPEVGPLQILGVGRPLSPAVALRVAEQIPDLVSRLAARARRVVLSCPPAVGSPETPTVLGAVQGALLVTAAQDNTTSDARSALDALDALGVEVWGGVLVEAHYPVPNWLGGQA